MTVAENLAILKTHVMSLESELADLQKGKKASGARSRKILQIVKITAHAMRKQVVEHVKSLPIKTKAKAKVEEPVEAVEAVEAVEVVEVKVAKKKKRK
jgi:IS5 family transposase